MGVRLTSWSLSPAAPQPLERFVARVSLPGNCRWVETIGGPGDDEVRAVALPSQAHGSRSLILMRRRGRVLHFPASG